MLEREKEEKSITDLIIERFVNVLGYTPDEKSNKNLKWMIENGYLEKKTPRHSRNTRGRPSIEELRTRYGSY